jgi:hypothetical protein
MFRFSLQILSYISLILRKIQPDVIITTYRNVCEVPIFLSDSNETIISRQFRKIPKYRISWKSYHLEPRGTVGTADGQTERETDGRTERRNEAKGRF